MVSKFLIYTVLASLVLVQGRNTSSNINNEIVPPEKEGRLLVELPIIGSLSLVSLRFVWFLISSAWSLIGYKLTALACAANVAIWFFENYFSVITGTAFMLGFCTLTGKCTYVQDQVYEVSEHLVQAGRNLETGVLKYGHGLM